MQKYRTFAWCGILLLSMAVAAVPAQTAPSNTEPAKKRLLDLAAQAGKVPEDEYTIQSWNEMRLALNDASTLAKQADASGKELADAYATLKSKVDRLQKRKVVPNPNPRVGLSASLFATDPAGPANHVALMWGSADPTERFEVRRAPNQAGPWTRVYTGTGASFNDYALAKGTWFYRMDAYRGGSKLSSNLASVTPIDLPAGLASYSNQAASDQPLPGKRLKVGDTYYDFKTERDGKALKHVLMRTSSDGQTWSEGTVVMDRDSHPDLADFKFEAVNIFYDKVNHQIVWWCHWELSGSHYGHGRAMVATARPGEPFKVHHIYNPLGVQVRDMSVYVDDDHTGYLAAASNLPGQGANATLYLFRLNKTYDDVVEIVAKVLENGYREAPHIIKHDGYYYLFYSQAAGWYPSRGGYVSAKSLAGPWSEPRSIGNASTFASQSGGIHEFGSGGELLPVMMGNRWIRGEGTSRNSAMPIHFADGFAFYDYAPVLLHDAAKGLLVPLHHGRLLSQSRPVEASIPGKAGHEVGRAFDGSYDSMFQSEQKDWPFSLTVDLGGPCAVRNVQVSWFLHKGSEAFYTYRIEGSSDGKVWSTLIDRSDKSDKVVSKTYGFTSDVLPEPAAARYVRLNVLRAHLHNNPNNWYPPTVYEVKVFGDPPTAR